MSLRLVFQAFVVRGRVPDPGRRGQHVDRRIERRAQPRVGGRRAHRLVPQAAPRFGTTYRLINLVVLLQIVTILLSRGDVYVLGEAYAFGVVWSFAFNALLGARAAVQAARGTREWRVPLNLRVGRTRVAVGLGLIALVLFAAAVVNLFTKQVATISGLAFTLGFFGALRRLRARRSHASRRPRAPAARSVPACAPSRRSGSRTCQRPRRETCWCRSATTTRSRIWMRAGAAPDRVGTSS